MSDQEEALRNHVLAEWCKQMRERGIEHPERSGQYLNLSMALMSDAALRASASRDEEKNKD